MRLFLELVPTSPDAMSRIAEEKPDRPLSTGSSPRDTIAGTSVVVRQLELHLHVEGSLELAPLHRACRGGHVEDERGCGRAGRR